MIGYNDGPFEIPNQENKKKYIEMYDGKRQEKKTINKIILQCN